jgi:trimeric autotransporter adhesin
MSTITLRATKGSPLTNTEVDTNFSNLNTDKLESTYAGAMNSLTGGTSIATLGTVTAGTWSASTIAATRGGTGQSTYAAGDILYASATNTLSKLAKPATAAYLKMASDGTPSWDALGLDDITATGTITTGTWNASVIGAAYGGTGIANNAANTIAFTGNYSLGLTLTANTSLTLPSSGTVATVAGSEALTNKSINGLTVTSSTGTLTITNAKTLSVSNTLTFTGTDASSVAFGAGGTVAYTNVGTLSSLVSVGTITTGTWSATTIATTRGGTGLTSYATGDIVYASASNTLSKLTAGTDGQILTLASGVPSWATSTAASTGKAIAMAMVFGG